MGRLINIGYGNLVNAEKVLSVVSPDSAPSKRLIQSARDEGCVIDATQGRRTKAIIVMENGWLILSALLPETIAARYHAGNQAPSSDNGADDEGRDESDE